MPDVVGAGEVTHLWVRGLQENQSCACGQPFADCPFWTSVGKAAFDGWDKLDVDDVIALKHRVDRTRFVGRLSLPTFLTRRRADLARYTDLYRRLYAGIAEVTGARVVIDSKHASLAFTLRHDKAIDLRVLHLVRDGRGVAYSWSKEVRRPEITDTTTLMPQYSMVKSATLWTAQNMFFDLLRTGAKVRRVKYEALIADPAGELGDIRRFAGLPADPLDFLSRDGDTTLATFGTSHSVAGNPMRFQHGGVPLRADSAWRTRMPAGQRRLVTLLTWPGRLWYGYLDLLGKRS